VCPGVNGHVCLYACVCTCGVFGAFPSLVCSLLFDSGMCVCARVQDFGRLKVRGGQKQEICGDGGVCGNLQGRAAAPARPTINPTTDVRR